MDEPIRRRDRVVDDEAWIEDFLARAPTGVLVVGAEGAPHVNANIFAYDRDARAVFVHTAREGATRRRAEATGQEAAFVCFEMGRILPATRAIGFSVEYASVVARGPLCVEADVGRAARALRLLMDKYAPHLAYGTDYDGVSARDLEQTSVYRLDVRAWSAKRNAKPEDFPGAYRYGERPPAGARFQEDETP